MLTWTDELTLGIEIIDNQHKSIFDQINLLMEAFEEGHEKEQSYEVLCFIEEYVHKHFQTEEFYLKKYDYKDLENHILMHRTFSKKLEDFKFRHKKSGVSTVLAAKEMVNFLNQWWFEHIKEVDSKYAQIVGHQINNSEE